MAVAAVASAGALLTSRRTRLGACQGAGRAQGRIASDCDWPRAAGCFALPESAWRGPPRPAFARQPRPRPSSHWSRSATLQLSSGGSCGCTGVKLRCRKIRRYRGICSEFLGAWRAFWFGFGLFTSVAGVALTCMPLTEYVLLADPHRRCLLQDISGLWARTLCRCWFNVEVVNPENLPSPGDPRSYVFVSNHQSFMDILAMFYLRRHFKFVSKQSVIKIPFIGYAMRVIGHIMFQRNDAVAQFGVIRRCLVELRKGSSVFFFPEGTRTRTGRLRQFKRGAAAIAKKAQVGLVPITVQGTGDIMPAGRELRLFPSPRGVRIIVHPVISVGEVRRKSAEELTEQTRATIGSALLCSAD